VNDAVQLTGVLEPRDAWTADACSMAAAIGVVGKRASLLILREAFYGATRFDEFARRAGISEPVTAARLRELVGEGLLEREPYREPGRRTRHAYRLTPKGADLLPALVALMQWGDRWVDDRGGPVDLRHAGCGESVHAELHCAAGHEVAPGELELARRAQASRASSA